MDLFKKLPFDLQERIYEDIMFKKIYDDFKSEYNYMIGCILNYSYNYDLMNEGCGSGLNCIKDGKLLPFNNKELFESIKEYEENEKKYFK